MRDWGRRALFAAAAVVAAGTTTLGQEGVEEVDVFDRFLIEEMVLSALAVPDGAIVEAIRGKPDAGGTTLVCRKVNAKAVTGEYMGWLDFTGVLYSAAGDPRASRFRRLIIGQNACPLPPVPEPPEPLAQP